MNELSRLRREPTEEEIAEFVASRAPIPDDSETMLRLIVDEAKAYWDNLRKPYPHHLKSAIKYLAERSSEAPATEAPASRETSRTEQRLRKPWNPDGYPGIPG